MTGSYVLPARPRPRFAWRPAILFPVLLLACCALMPWVTQLSLCCGLPIAVASFFVAEKVVQRRGLNRGAANMFRVALLAACIAGMFWLRPSGKAAFEAAFDMPLPSGVTEIKYELRASHPLDGEEIRLRFLVTPAAFAAMVSDPRFVQKHGAERAATQPLSPVDGIVAYEVFAPDDSDRDFPDVSLTYNPATGEVVARRHTY